MTRGNERRILDQCAPALTGVKTGSLLKVDRSVCTDALELLAPFKEEGIGTKLLCTRGSSSLILVYGQEMLSSVLSDPEVGQLLSEMGYSGSECWTFACSG